MVPGWIYKFLHSKRNFKQNKKPSHEVGENICKWYTDGINFQNVHTSQDQKTKNPIKIKWAEDPNRHTDGQRQMKRFSEPLIAREMQIKTPMRNHLTSVNDDENSHHQKLYK